MQTRPQPSLRVPPLLVAAVAAAGAVGTAWYLDALRRAGWSARLHRTLVELLLNALSSDDALTERHGRRVAELAESLAEAFGIDGQRHAVLRVASLLHDMGKIDDALYDIVHGKGKLDSEERGRIRKHPTESAQILEPLDPFHPGLSLIVRSHHERWDGTGYPAGLRGEQIPLEARLISVADVFDALTQPRSYKDACTVEDALAELREGAGTLFDPAVVEVLERPEVRRRWTEIARSGRERERVEAAAGRA